MIAMKQTKQSYFRDEDDNDKKLLAVIIIMMILFFVATCHASCVRIKKSQSTKRLKSDSISVKKIDSTVQKKEEKKEHELTLEDFGLQFEYDTTIKQNGGEWKNIDDSIYRNTPINADDYFTPEGKALSDAIKAASKGGKLKKVIITGKKVESKYRDTASTVTTNVRRDDSTVHNVELKEHTMIKNKSRAFPGWIIIPILLIGVAIWFFFFRKKEDKTSINVGVFTPEQFNNTNKSQP